jgi:hypothetical protein
MRPLAEAVDVVLDPADRLAVIDGHGAAGDQVGDQVWTASVLVLGGSGWLSTSAGSAPVTGDDLLAARGVLS